MRVSCIIPTYRKFDYLKQAIDSVISQTFPDIELIITDDASDNIKEEEIRSYVEKNKKCNITSFKLKKHKSNVGTVKNMNSAINISSGNIIVPLAADDKFASEDVIAKIVKRFEESKCDILVCSRILCSEDMSIRYRLMPCPSYRSYIDRHLNTAHSQFVHLALEDIMEFASGSSMYYTKIFFDSVGGYDERYRLWEDGPFIAKVTRQGYMIETAYDIVAILYRDGGISSNSQSGNLKDAIHADYRSAIVNEYLAYPENFNRHQIRVIKGLCSINGRSKIPLVQMVRYPETIINLFYKKIKYSIYMHMMKLGKYDSFTQEER